VQIGEVFLSFYLRYCRFSLPSSRIKGSNLTSKNPDATSEPVVTVTSTGPSSGPVNQKGIIKIIIEIVSSSFTLGGNARTLVTGLKVTSVLRKDAKWVFDPLIFKGIIIGIHLD